MDPVFAEPLQAAHPLMLRYAQSPLDHTVAVGSCEPVIDYTTPLDHPSQCLASVFSISAPTCDFDPRPPCIGDWSSRDAYALTDVNAHDLSSIVLPLLFHPAPMLFAPDCRGWVRCSRIGGGDDVTEQYTTVLVC